MPSDKATRADVGAAMSQYLRERGHTVEEQDIPGLYRIDGGPEITLGHLIQIANEVASGKR